MRVYKKTAWGDCSPHLPVLVLESWPINQNKQMKTYKNPQAAEFEINKITYRVEPDYASNSCEWWVLGDSKHKRNRCELDDPAWPILAADEDWPFSMELYMLLDTEDTHIHGEFLKALNRAVRHFLPKGHPKWCPEVSERYKRQEALSTRNRSWH